MARGRRARSRSGASVPDSPGLLFDRVAEDYDRVRPDYPAALVDEACSLAGLRPGSRVLEVGCGTGKLTRALAERGLSIDAVDPGPELVAVARRHLEGSAVRFHLGRFEDIELPLGSFEAVFSATAFHWVDPDVGWAKVARLLVPGGVLALLAHVGDWSVELQSELLAAWREVVPEAAGWVAREPQELWAGAEERMGNVSELWTWLEKRDIARPEGADLFTDVRLATEASDTAVSADEAVALVRTQSAYLGLDQERRQRLEARLTAVIERTGGTLRETSYATLVTARAAPRRATA